MSPAGPPPSAEGFLSASDGLRLAWYRWDPPRSPRGTVVLTHGLGEHVGRYRHVAEAFLRAGFAFLGFDLRGHGNSEGPRGHSPSYPRLLDDLDRVLRTAPAQPRLAYGHSMGGQIVLSYGRANPSGIAAVIATGPWLRLAFPAPAVKVLMGRILGPVLPAVSLPTGLEVPALSRDPEVCAAYRADPLVHDRISFRMGIDILDGGERAIAEAPAFSLPVYLAHGESDRIVDPQATRAFYAAAGSTDKTLKLYPGYFHEVHNEPEWRDVLTHITGWAGEHAA